MTFGTLILGLSYGLTIGLLAVGLVLVYKSNRFLNLAHGQLGTVPAVLLVKFVLDDRVDWWIALVASVAIGTGTGLAVERLFIRPIRRRTQSAVAPLLLTIGVTQVLLGLTYLPALTPHGEKGAPFPQPFSASVGVGGVVLSAMDILTLVTVPVAVSLLAAFFKYSSTGKQIRAAASNPDSARLCGISVARVSAITWGLAGGLSALSAIFAAPTQGASNAAALGPPLLLLTLGAAAFGAFVSLPAALVGGLTLGLASQTVSAITSNGNDAQLAVFLIILAVIVVRGKAIGKVFAHTGGALAEVPVTRIPDVLRSAWQVRYQRPITGTVAIVAAVIVPLLPGLHSPGNRFLLTLVLVYALIGLSLTMLVGWGGQVSLGHFAIVGVGAFITGRLSAHHWTLPVMLILAGLAGSAAAVVIALPALRIPGLTLTVATLGLAVVAPTWLYRQTWFGTDNPNGLNLAPPALLSRLGVVDSQLRQYYLALGVLVVAAVALGLLRRSVPGRLVVAVRDNYRAAAARGISPGSVRISTLAVSGFFAGAAGVVWASSWQVVSIGQFTPDLSIVVLAIPVVGGVGSVSGAIGAAVMLYVPAYFLAPHLTGIIGSVGGNLGFVLMLGGLGQVATILNFPAGMAGAVQEKWQAYLDRTAARVEGRTGPAVPAPAPAQRAGGGARPAPAPALTSKFVGNQIARLLPAVRDVGVAIPLVAGGIEVRFGGIHALNGATIEVRPGEIVGLIGSNGAGKSTLLNVISGLQEPSGGSVRLFGHDVTDLPPELRASFGLGRTFQDGALFAGLTVKETLQVATATQSTVGFFAAMVNAPWALLADAASERVALGAVERFGLGPWTDVRIAELSTGTRRICELAAQSVARPKLILLDEPTGGVAQREAEAFGPMLRKLRAELDCSALIIEHDMHLLMGLCDRVYAMETGGVIAEGTPAEIVRDPRVIASYLGTDDRAIARSTAAHRPKPAKKRVRSS